MQLRRQGLLPMLAVVPTILSLLVGFLPAAPARAEMKYFQIARLLNFKTTCNMRSFEDKSAPTGPGRFLVHCDNVTSYPDGLLLECPDRLDEWTCRFLTAPKSYEGLELLRKK